MKNKTFLRFPASWGVATALLITSGLAFPACDQSIPLTRPPSRYEVVNGTGTSANNPPEVRDTVTGLIWMRCLLGQQWNGTTCAGDISFFNWTEALEAARNATASTAATGTAAVWRVPNIAELRSLVERACQAPAMNTNVFPGAPAYQGAYVWTSSPSAIYSNSALVLDFYQGLTTLTSKSGTSYNANVRLVRAGQ